MAAASRDMPFHLTPPSSSLGKDGVTGTTSPADGFLADSGGNGGEDGISRLPDDRISDIVGRLIGTTFPADGLLAITDGDGGEDRISRLPDELLSNIVARRTMVSSENILERRHTPGSKPEDTAPQTQTSLERSLPEGGPAAPCFCLICMQPVDRSGADMMRCGEDETTSIRVTNLSKNTCEKDLYNLGCLFGFIARVTLESDEKAVSHTQIGIVEFEERDAAEKAIELLNGHSYDSFSLQVDWAPPELKKASVPVLKDGYDPAPICGTCMQVVKVSVHVTNLPENTCEHDLYNLFCQFGFINRFYLALDDKAGSRMQCGIVEFEQREDAEMAISLIDGHVYGGNDLQVNWATVAVLSAQRRLN